MGVLLIYSMLMMAVGMFDGGCRVDDPQGIEQTETLGRFEFPESAMTIQSECGGMQGWGLSASFEMLPADLRVFQASTSIEASQWVGEMPEPRVFGTGYSQSSAQMRTWSEEMESFIYGFYTVTEFSQEVLIDTSNPNRFRVFIEVLGG